MEILKNGSERVQYDYDGYFTYIRKSFLSAYPNYSADSHWHDDLEFIYVLSGSMTCSINGNAVEIAQGNGIMINARQLHHGYSTERKECEYLCIIFHPMMLCTTQSIDRDFVSPILSDETLPYILLNRHTQWQQSILSELLDIFNSRDLESAPLLMQASFYRIWQLIFQNAAKISRLPQKRDRQLYILKDMLAYIQKNYMERISLSDIAESGNVSKSTCLVIFKKYLSDTPTNYLIGYRLKRASQLLDGTDLPVSEIAPTVGFPGISYFTETFHKNFGCTPSEYREKARSTPHPN